MHFRTLESRIITLFLVLVLAVQLGGFFVIRNGIVDNAQATMREQLKLGENLFNRLLEQKKQRLTDSARVLAKDTGFRSAITIQVEVDAVPSGDGTHDLAVFE